MTYLALASLFLIGCTLTGGLVARAWHQHEERRGAHYAAKVYARFNNPRAHDIGVSWCLKSGTPYGLVMLYFDGFEDFCAMIDDLYGCDGRCEYELLDGPIQDDKEHP